MSQLFYQNIWLILSLIIPLTLLSLSEGAVKRAREQDPQQLKKLLEFSDTFPLFVRTIMFIIAMLVGAALRTIVGEINWGKIYLFKDRSEELLFVHAFSVATFLVVGFLFVLLTIAVPRNVGILFPDQTIKVLHPLMKLFIWLFAPFVRLIESIAALFVGKEKIQQHLGGITSERLQQILEESAESGVVAPEEELIMNKVFRLGNRNADSLMTPRKDVVWLDEKDPVIKMWDVVVQQGFSYYPVARGSVDQIIGVVSMKSISESMVKNEVMLPKSSIKEPLSIPASTPAFFVLEQFKSESRQMALVIDEYGGLDGVITLHDLLESLVGELQSEGEEGGKSIIKQDGENYLVDASIDVEELFDHLNVKDPDYEERKGYYSLGGFIMGHLGHIPKEGEKFEYLGYYFEVVDMDGNRIDKVQVKKKET